jgi:hypothetical protein
MKSRLSFALVLMLALVGCSSNSYKSDFDKQTNFSAIKTYSWGKNIAHGTDNRFLSGKPLNAVIQDDIDQTLAAKGFRKVETGGDVTVQFKSIVRFVGAGSPSGGVDETKLAEDANDSFNLSVGDSGPVVQDSYTEGSVIVLVSNPAGKPVWRGVGQSVVKQVADDSKREANLKKSIDTILASFPPK